MRALASSLGAWDSLEEQERVQGHHGLTFALAVLGEIGRPYGLELFSDECSALDGYDAIFVSVMDARVMLATAARFRRWGLPLRRRDRSARHPLVWAGGQGLHNPLPYAEVADLIVVGDAEEPLPALLHAWQRHGNGRAFLAEGASVPGVFVPSQHDLNKDHIQQALAPEIGVSLRARIKVNLNGTRRLEIARNCARKCAFCGLGWRAPVRENSSEDIRDALDGCERSVHLQAANAEAHHGIEEIRSHLQRRGIYDQGWTGTLVETAQTTHVIPASKRFAFGIEGLTYGVRNAVGKGDLTDERIATCTCAMMERTQGTGKGRIAWHMIAGLPGEQANDIFVFLSLLKDIYRRRRGGVPRNLALHWQPFQPLPGTPLQWEACGGGARRLAALVRGFEGDSWVQLIQRVGRTDEVARLCTILGRSDGRAVELLEAVERGHVDAAHAEALTGTTWGSLDPDAPLPWDFVEHAYSREILRRAHKVVRRRIESSCQDRGGGARR